MTQDWICHFPLAASSLSQPGVCGLSVLPTPRTFITYLPPAYVSPRNIHHPNPPHSSPRLPTLRRPVCMQQAAALAFPCSSHCPHHLGLETSKTRHVRDYRQYGGACCIETQQVFINKIKKGGGGGGGGVNFREIQHNDG